MSSKSKIRGNVEMAINLSMMHYEKFKEFPIQKGYRFECKKGFVVEWFKVNQQTLTELIKYIENEKSTQISPELGGHN